MSVEETHFAQHLASNDRRIRDKALKRMRKWLQLRSQKEESEFTIDGMMRLWKGLFYCMWMADKSLVQEELADNIGSLIHAFAKPSQSYHFVGAFFKTMGRNHDHIDKFRIDKFLMLIRRFFRASLQYLKSRNWECKHVQKYLSTLRESVLSPKQDSREIALGFRLHFFDIFLEELARAGEGKLSQKRAHNFLEPFYEVLTYCKSPLVVEGVRDKVFIQLVKLNAGLLQEESDADTDDDEEEEINGLSFIDDEAEEFNGCFVDEEEEMDSDEGDITEQRIRKAEAKEMASQNSHASSDQSDAGSDNEEEEAASEDETAAEENDEAEVNLLPIDFDMSAIKESLIEFSRVEGIKRINRKAIEIIVKKIIDLENGVNPFAVESEDSGSDIELTEDELKIAEKRLSRLQKLCAEEAENCLIPERDVVDEGDDDDFEMEGGEDDAAEFEKAFVDDFSRENRQPSRKKSKKKSKKSSLNGGGDHLSDSDDEHMGEIEKDIDELNFRETKKPRKRKLNNAEAEVKPGCSKSQQKRATNKSNEGDLSKREKQPKKRLSGGKKKKRT